VRGQGRAEGWRERDRQLSSPSGHLAHCHPFLATSFRCGQQVSVREDMWTVEHACPHIVPQLTTQLWAWSWWVVG